MLKTREIKLSGKTEQTTQSTCSLRTLLTQQIEGTLWLEHLSQAPLSTWKAKHATLATRADAILSSSMTLRMTSLMRTVSIRVVKITKALTVVRIVIYLL
jgi:hypothetical protein